MKILASAFILVILLSVNAYSLDLMSGAVGYAVGKKGNSQAVNPGAPVMGVLPVECWLNDDGTCGSSRPIKLTEVCKQIGPNYTAAGFMKKDHESSYVLILCSKSG